MKWKKEKRKTTKQKNKKKKKKEDCLRDSIKLTNPGIIGVPEWEEKRKDKFFLLGKITAKTTPNLVKETDIQVQEVDRVPNKWIQRDPYQDTLQLKCQKLKRNPKKQ